MYFCFGVLGLLHSYFCQKKREKFKGKEKVIIFTLTAVRSSVYLQKKKKGKVKQIWKIAFF